MRTRFGGGAVIVVLTALALGPVLLSRGPVLVGDMTFVPQQPWKSAWLALDGSVPRAVPADAIVSVLSQVIPGDLLQKVILFGALAAAGLGMLRLLRDRASAAAAVAAAVLYVWNPFVFERLAIGHWGLLIGYAVLPWVLAAAMDARRGSPGALGRLVLFLAVAAIGSPTGGLAAAFVALVMVVDRDRPRRAAIVLAGSLAVNLPWLAPAVLNSAGTSDTTGVSAFAARSDTAFGAWGSLLSFGGIWKAAVVPAERESLLLAGLAVLICLASLYAVKRAPERARLWLLALTGLVLAGLPTSGPGERFVARLVADVPGAGILRDSQKWVLLLVVVVCFGFALLVDAAAVRARRHGMSGTTVLVAFAVLPVLVLPSLAWGLSGRLKPVEVPTEWQTVSNLLEEAPADQRRTMVLPWSAYQRLPWNRSRAALDPAIRYFPGQVVTNEDLGVDADETVRGEGRSSARIGAVITRGESVGPVLAREGVRYVLIEKTASSSRTVDVPEAAVLHDGPELRLLDLGTHGRVEVADRRGLIIAADVLGLLAVLAAGLAIVRRKSGQIG